MSGECDVDDQIREMLRRRCCQRHTRVSVFSTAMPTDWRPQTLLHPQRPAEYFTDDSAWQFVAERIAAGAPIERIVLQMPLGKMGYVLKVSGCPPVSVIYIKLQLGSSNVIGRSFHASTVVTNGAEIDGRFERSKQGL